MQNLRHFRLRKLFERTNVFELLKDSITSLTIFVRKKGAGFPPQPKGWGFQPEDLMIPDPKLTPKTMIAMVEILLLSKRQMSENDMETAMNLIYRLMRKYVFRLAKSWTYSHAHALDVAAEFWNYFWKNRLINQYSRNCSSFVKWFDEGVTNWLVNEASV